MSQGAPSHVATASGARRLLTGGLGAAGLAVVLCACGSQPAANSASRPTATATSAPSGTPRQLIDRAILDARARGSVHEVEHDIGDGVRSMTNNAGNHAGTQTIVLSNGSVAHVLLDGNTAYIRANARTLSSYFGLPGPLATTAGHRWISVPSTNHNFSAYAYDLTLSTVLDDLAMKGHLTEVAPTKIDGQPVIGVLGALPVSGGRSVLATVYISETRTPLPVEASYQAADGSSLTKLSHWGERLSIAAPRGAVASASLG